MALKQCQGKQSPSCLNEDLSICECQRLGAGTPTVEICAHCISNPHHSESGTWSEFIASRCRGFVSFFHQGHRAMFIGFAVFLLLLFGSSDNLVLRCKTQYLGSTYLGSKFNILAQRCELSSQNTKPRTTRGRSNRRGLPAKRQTFRLNVLLDSTPLPQRNRMGIGL